MSDPKMLERIAKLLNQAENAGTEAEAATFMERAQQLAAAHSIDLARARHATVAKERTVPVQRSIYIGESRSRGLRTICDLALGILAANDCKCTIAHDASTVYAVGFAEDLDVAEAMFASLLTQQQKALGEFKKLGEWRNETVYHEPRDWYSRGEYKPQTWLTARLNFQDSFASRIRGRLFEAKWAEEDRQRKLEQERAKRPHLTDDGQVSEAFSLWLRQTHNVELDRLDDEDSFAAEFVEMLRDIEDQWTQELIGEWQSALDEQQRQRDSVALVLASKRDAVKDAAAPMMARARGSYRGGTSGAQSSSGRAAGRAAGDRASLGSQTAMSGAKGAISR